VPRPPYRCHLAAAVRMLRPSPLCLVASKSMNIAGVSRRSAAPGSQNIGVAEYGDDRCEFRRREVLARKPEFKVHTVACGSPSIQVRPPVQPRAAARWRAGGATLNAIHARSGVQARGREFLPSHTSCTTVFVCAILCRSTASPQKPAPFAAAELSTHRMPPPSETAANPSFNLTHSGLRPPRAS
jgi:hypothetical protein